MDYPYGYCGMPCALCSRYRTNGSSRCMGCSAGGYYTEGCKVCRCCRDRGADHCGLCGEFPCARLGKMGDFRDLNTGGAKLLTCAAVSSGGFSAWYDQYCRKADLLTLALERYNDGRMKRFLCEVFIQRDLRDLEEIMRRAEGLSGTAKEKGAGFRAIVEHM